MVHAKRAWPEIEDWQGLLLRGLRQNVLIIIAALKAALIAIGGRHRQVNKSK
jgi:hypothetical protein